MARDSEKQTDAGSTKRTRVATEMSGEWGPEMAGSVLPPSWDCQRFNCGIVLMG